MLPNLKHLQYLISLHQHQNFHRAAAASFVSQSTLSSAILKLEEQLSCQLIERDNKSFIFTALGEQVVEHARGILAQAAELSDYCRANGLPESGTVRLGCIPTIAPFLLSDVVKACRERLPKINMFIREDTTENLLKLLEIGELDTLILALPIPNQSFHSKLVGQDPFYILADPKLIELTEKEGNYANLPDESVFLLSEEHCLTGHTISACHLADPEKINSFHATSIATLLQMTEHHNGLTFLPKMAVDKGVAEHSNLSVRPVKNGPYREIGMMWRQTSLRRQTFEMISQVVEGLLKKDSKN